ncbi:CehA/McbA family metallohydrolase [Robertmurraya massiliosenegalensis]|uniref:CehA/McbA family metallohydrolase n=1 Tax=Robertmurraya TaxID=2837507 RepID=UPI0039A50CE2
MKSSIIIPIKPFAVKLDQSIDKNRLKEHVIHRMSFEVDKRYEQLVITFQGDKIRWFTCNVYHQNEVRGQALQTMKKPMETICIGSEETFNSATSVPGMIMPGSWEVEFEFFPDAAETIELEVNYELRERGEVSRDYLENQRDIYVPLELIHTAKKWYKGDFHTHTHYSDGEMTRERNLESAKNQKLDFFVATDHNLVTHYWPNEEDVLPFPGTELTAPGGHGNFLFAEKPIFRNCCLADMYSEEGVNRIIECNLDNGLFSINHPFLSPWAWLMRETKLDMVTSLELCNDPTYSENRVATEKALTFWSVLLNDGYHITGIGGSDSHLLPEEKYPEATEPSLIGDPGTYIYADGLTAEALKAGIQAGHAVLSRDGFIDIKVSGEELLPGDTLLKGTGVFDVILERVAPAKIQWVVDGEIVKVDESNEASYEYQFEDGSYHWIRVDVRDTEDRFIGTSNPFYWGKKQTSLRTWGDALDEWNRKKSNTF